MSTDTCPDMIQPDPGKAHKVAASREVGGAVMQMAHVWAKEERPGTVADARVTGYSLVPLRDLMARPDTPVEYLLEGRLVAGTVSAVVAKPKVGKSTLARNLALAVSTGRPFLGMATRQGEVIYLALEERGEDIKADFAAMGATGEEPVHIHASHAPEAAMQELVGLVRTRKPRLVVIDPLFRLARIRDEKAYAETYQALGPLIDIARETGAHMMLAHHAGKGIKADAIDAPLGSTALGGIVSTLFVLKRTESYRTLQTVQRIGSDLAETVLAFDSATRMLSVGATRKEADQKVCEAETIEYLKAVGAGEEKTEPEISEHVEGDTGVRRKALRSLVEKGDVARTGTGKKGNAYKYSFACLHHIPQTSKQETENQPQPSMNTDEKLVCENSQEPLKQMLVCEAVFEVAL